MSDLNTLAAALVDGSVQVIDLTSPLHSETPRLALPPEFGQTAVFELEEISEIHPSVQHLCCRCQLRHEHGAVLDVGVGHRRPPAHPGRLTTASASHAAVPACPGRAACTLGPLLGCSSRSHRRSPSSPTLRGATQGMIHLIMISQGNGSFGARHTIINTEIPVCRVGKWYNCESDWA